MWVQAAKEILRADDDTVSYMLAGLILGTGVVGTLGGGPLHTPPHCTPQHPMKMLLLHCLPLSFDLCSLLCVRAHLGSSLCEGSSWQLFGARMSRLSSEGQHMAAQARGRQCSPGLQSSSALTCRMGAGSGGLQSEECHAAPDGGVLHGPGGMPHGIPGVSQRGRLCHPSGIWPAGHLPCAGPAM